jgi:hypothetical protein
MNFDKNYPESRNYRKFSTDLSFGTANSGNKALYGEKNFYCENQFAHGPSGTFSRDHINPGTANTIHKEDIEKIIFQVNSMPETGDAPPVGTVFELWPNDQSSHGWRTGLAFVIRKKDAGRSSIHCLYPKLLPQLVSAQKGDKPRGKRQCDCKR